MIEEQEFLYKLGEASLYRFKDKLLGYRYMLVDGRKEIVFDNEKEVHARFKREEHPSV